MKNIAVIYFLFFYAVTLSAAIGVSVQSIVCDYGVQSFGVSLAISVVFGLYLLVASARGGK